MILRRIATAIRRQDRVAVAIEFVIVVAGIFVGLEVSNWNEARKFAAQKQPFLAKLRDEIDRNNQAIEYQT